MGKFTVDIDLVLPHRCNVRGFHWSPIMDQFGELTKLMNYTCKMFTYRFKVLEYSFQGRPRQSHASLAFHSKHKVRDV